MSYTTTVIREAARDLATILRQPESPESNEQLDKVAGDLLVAVADGFATLVEAAEQALGPTQHSTDGVKVVADPTGTMP